MCLPAQGQYQTAISHLKRVLEISKEMADHVGDADAYGTIAGSFTSQDWMGSQGLEQLSTVSHAAAEAVLWFADIYTDIGDLEAAGEFYDLYIKTMTTEGSVV